MPSNRIFYSGCTQLTSQKISNGGSGLAQWQRQRSAQDSVKFRSGGLADSEGKNKCNHKVTPSTVRVIVNSPKITVTRESFLGGLFSVNK
jgi:hypothetical protein